MRLVRVNALGALDGNLRDKPTRLAGGVSALLELSPGRVHLVALGRPAEIDVLTRRTGTPATIWSHPTGVLLPGLVNAHTHLDLTHIGPRPFDASQGFAGFIRVVLSNRLTDEGALRASIEHGVRLCRAGGVVAVGDIGGVVASAPSLVPWRVLRNSGLWGVSYLEFFGLGNVEDHNLKLLEAALREHDAHGAGRREIDRLVLGLQPHAPYTASPRAFARAGEVARERGMALCTHLAETPEEREFVAQGSGPFRAFLERAQWWNEASDGIAGAVGQGESSVAYFCRALGGRSSRYLLAHVNDASDADLEQLAGSGHSVVYCPRSSAYFRNHEHFGSHRYRDMLAAGVNVCLGTDSVINLPNWDRLSTLDEARALRRRDRAAPEELLAMMTTRGARALGLAEAFWTFAPGQDLGGLAVVDVGEQAVHADASALLLRVLEGDGEVALLAG